MSAGRGIDWRALPVLVTGGYGFIGSHLVDALVARGARVRVLDDLSTGRRENLAHAGPQVERLEGTILDRPTCERACRGVALVFHQAALGSVPRSLAQPARTIAVNVLGTANLFEAARDAGVERVVYASSSSVYGDATALPRVEGEEGEALSPYALSKQMGESLAAVFGHAYGMELIGLRYFNVYGPRQREDGPYAAVVPRFFDACARGAAPRIFGDGEQSRDFTFVGDAVRANLLAAAAPPAACGRAYNVGGGDRTTIARLARLIRRLVGKGEEPVYEPPRPGDVRHSLADLRAAGAMLDYRPQVALADGLAATWRAWGG